MVQGLIEGYGSKELKDRFLSDLVQCEVNSNFLLL